MGEPKQKPGRSKQDYGTPMAFIRACEKRFGRIVCDLAATEQNRKAPRHYGSDNGQDSLLMNWSKIDPTGTLWLNPPFANIGEWAAKCAYESVRRRGFLLLLTPASIGTDWFGKHVAPFATVLGLAPRLTFEGTTDPYPKDLMLSVYGYGFVGFGTWRWDNE